MGFEVYEHRVEFMRACEGKVVVGINDHLDIRRMFEEFRIETMDIRYSTANPRQGKAAIMNWAPDL